ncbi:MAG: MBL fold metallo-hydrolase [Promethearchaeota archaeon]
MVKISFLGACREVGRSAILLESSKGNKILLDYGIRFNKEDRLPLTDGFHDLKAVILTHCHIDHSGGLPYLFKELNCPLYTNPLTLQVSEILLKDMLKISKQPYMFGFRELDKMRSSSILVEYDKSYKITDDITITTLNAGHVPGSLSILIKIDDKKILYTGDINTQDTNLIPPANMMNNSKLDVIITESTYALTKHPKREQLESEFVDLVMNITENEGNVLIPAFSVARSQEIFLILKKMQYAGPIFLDGLARKISLIYKNYPMELRNYKFFKHALNDVKFVRNNERKKLVKHNGNVIISPSGMLRGGAAINYVKHFVDDPASAVYFVGYQVEGYPGKTLLDEGIFKYEENNKWNDNAFKIQKKASCDIKYFDFSSHVDNELLHEYIDNLSFNENEKYAFCIHGENKAVTALARELSKKDFNSVAPEIGETYTI